MIPPSDRFETIKKIMSDGKMRTTREICEQMGYDKYQSVKVSKVMKTYVKYGFCVCAGYVTDGGYKSKLWKWIE